MKEEYKNFQLIKIKNQIIELAEYLRTHFTTEINDGKITWKSLYSGNIYTDKDVSEFFLSSKHKQV